MKEHMTPEELTALKMFLDQKPVRKKASEHRVCISVYRPRKRDISNLSRRLRDSQRRNSSVNAL